MPCYPCTTTVLATLKLPRAATRTAGGSLAGQYSEERKLQQWFNTSTYVTLEPNSYSRRILNDQVLTCQTAPLAVHAVHVIHEHLSA